MLDKEAIKSNFSKSAAGYDEHAQLQKGLADDLFQAAQKLQPDRILDIGCGTGYLTRRLAEHFSGAKAVGIDIAPGMIEVASAKNRLINLRFEPGDGEELSFAEEHFDLVVSNASLQWMDSEKVFEGVLRVLKKGGYFIFNTFGPRTLCELKASGFRVNRFASAAELSALSEGGFRMVEMRSRMVKQNFNNVRHLIGHLREIGAQNPDPGARPNILRAIRKHRAGSAVNASYEVISGVIVKGGF